MSKSLDNLTLAQLLELKSGADAVSDFYAEQLTDYAVMNDDAKLVHMPTNVRLQHEKRRKAKQLSLILLDKIEEQISEYYV